MDLRPYQQNAIKNILSEWSAGRKRTLLVLPTGTGKTIVFCVLIEELVRNGERVLILAHRAELLNQAADKLNKATGLGCSVEKADQTCLDEWFRVVVGSVQTLMSPKRLAKFRPDYFTTIIVDECHRVLADSYTRILDHFAGAKVLGVTATPDRGDRRDLNAVFHSLAYEYTLPQAIREGFLCPIQALSIPLKIDLGDIKARGGDYAADDLGNALEPYLNSIAGHMQEHCQDRKTVVFLPLIRTSQMMRDILNHWGFQACEVNGNSPDRVDILRDFEAGRYNVLCNSMLLTEGWDCPPVDCIVPLRPTKIRSLFCQMVGRGTRIHPGKDNLLLLDFLWNTAKLDLCRPAHIIAEDSEIADVMTTAINQGGGKDLLELHEEVERDLMHERDKALAAALKKNQNKKSRLVNPIQYEMSIMSHELATYKPSFGWEMEPPTGEMRERLEHYGIAAEAVESAGKAALVLETIQKRAAAGLTTAKQIRLLEQKGFHHVGEWSMDSARRMIARIEANGWRVPVGVCASEYKP